MKQRSIQIARTLSESKEPVTIGELASTFEVTQRTIRNDLNELSDLLEQNNYPRLSFESGGQIVLPENLGQIRHVPKSQESSEEY